MAVKIIGHPLPRRVVCRNCDCELEYLKVDVLLGVAQQQHPYYYIECPNCKHNVQVEKHLPPNSR